jgi:hypothetical protein
MMMRPPGLTSGAIARKAYLATGRSTGAGGMGDTRVCCAGSTLPLNSGGCLDSNEVEAMRAETETIVDEIKQSVGLLRRHL